MQDEKFATAEPRLSASENEKWSVRVGGTQLPAYGKDDAHARAHIINSAHSASLEAFREKCIEAIKDSLMISRCAAEELDSPEARVYEQATNDAIKAVREVRL